MYYDDCSDNSKLSIYQNKNVTLYSGSGTHTTTYYTSGYYQNTETGQGIHGCVLTHTPNDFRVQWLVGYWTTESSSFNTQIAIFLQNRSNTSSNTYPKLVKTGNANWLEYNGTTSFTFSRATYYLFEVIRQNGVLTANVYNEAGTNLLATQNKTLTSTYTGDVNIGLGFGTDNNNIIRFKKVLIKEL